VITATRTADPLELPAVSLADRDHADDVAVGVIGCGLHSTTAIMPSLRHARTRLVAVCDLDADRAEAARAQFGAQKAYGSVDALLGRDDLDAVIVVGPPELHVLGAVAALEAGHHVFVEKPPGSTAAEAERIQTAARTAGKQAMVGFMKRHASAYRLVKQVMAAAEFGPVTSVEMAYAHWPVTGIRLHLIDMSVHALDTIRWLLGDPVRMAVFKRSIDGRHVLTLMTEHAGGAVGRLDLSAFAPGVQERLVVTGDDAVVRLDNLTVAYVRQISDASAYEANRRTTRTWAPEFSLPDRENDTQILQGYATELIAFAEAIRIGEPVSASIDDGVAAMRLVEAIAAAPEGLSIVEV
jgi:myo-inositol 2-dehydrogenase/D-chiro-inositol 1-dehydrogenase